MSTLTCIYEGCLEEAVNGTSYCAEHAPSNDVTDEMIVRASIPSAAALLKRAARQGYIQPTSGYAASST